MKSERLQNIASIAFGGADRRTAYLGSLMGTTLATFRSPVPGRPLPHWGTGSELAAGALERRP